MVRIPMQCAFAVLSTLMISLVASFVAPITTTSSAAAKTQCSLLGGVKYKSAQNEGGTKTFAIKQSNTYEQKKRSLEDRNVKSTNEIISTSNTFLELAKYSYNILLQSDLKLNDGFDGASTGWTSWVEVNSSKQLHNFMDQLIFSTAGPSKSNSGIRNTTTTITSSNDIKWMKWLKQITPKPIIIDLSKEFRNAANLTIQEDDLKRINTNHSKILNRIGCNLLILPSSTSFLHNLYTPPGGLTFGKLLWGGITKYRLLPSRTKIQRRTGVKKIIESINNNDNEISPSWLQYGGCYRNYDSMDIGSAGLLEITLLPKGVEIDYENSIEQKEKIPAMMMLQSSSYITKYIQLKNNTNVEKKKVKKYSYENKISDAHGSNNNTKNNILEKCITTSVGGLQNQIYTIIRRVLDGRIIISSNNANSSSSDIFTLEQQQEEYKTLQSLGLNPVKGLLLHGPPGCGKTSIARELSNILLSEHNNNPQQPRATIISATELLDRWVGGTEQNIRDLFSTSFDNNADYDDIQYDDYNYDNSYNSTQTLSSSTELPIINGNNKNIDNITTSNNHEENDYSSSSSSNDNVIKNPLQIVIIDEIDALFRKRSSSTDGGDITRASAVNQLLSILDGVQTPSTSSIVPIEQQQSINNNILLIGITNRKDILDEALLRPGRLEVHIEIPLPDKEARREILNIHFGKLREKGRLSQPLCHAIDGATTTTTTTASSSLYYRLKQKTTKIMHFFPKLRNKQNYNNYNNILINDLADDAITKGYSGADIAGLVRCSVSIALARSRKDGNGIDGLLVTLNDVAYALIEMKR